MADREQNEASVQRCYSTWGTVYYDEYYGADAPYPPVHVDLQRDVLKAAGSRTLLDAGCGPASFLRHVANDGIDLFGFDLTAEMVAEARRIFSTLGLDPDRIRQGSVADPGAFRSTHPDYPEAFDAVVCGGVLPHIPEAIEPAVFANILGALRPGGVALIEARNQFFSLFTGNRYTYDFIMNELVRREDLVQASGEAGPALDAALDGFKKQFRMDLPPVRSGKADEPGYDEVLSRTHNPLLLKQQLEAAGFAEVELLFYHFHCVPPMLAGAAQDRFIERSVAMENPRDWRGHFMASAMIAVGKRP